MTADDPLVVAARAGDLAALRPLLDREWPQEARDRALFSAATAATARLLLAYGATIDAAGRLGQSPLHAAAQAGRLGVAWLLLLRGAAVDARQERGYTPLHWAATRAVAALLLDHGASIEATSADGTRPLHAAIGGRHRAVALLLLDRGAAADVPDRGGSTPLHDAASAGDLVIVRRLLAAGAAVERADGHGRTPLHRVASQSATLPPRRARAIVALLLAAGADPYGRAADGRTPLDLAAASAPESAVVRALRRWQTDHPEPPPPARPAARLLCLHPRRREAVTASFGGVLARWSLGDAAIPREVVRAGSPRITALAADPAGGTIAVATGDGPLGFRAWDGLASRATLDGPAEAHAVAYAPDGRWLAVADGDGAITLHDRRRGTVAARFDTGGEGSIVAIDPRSRLLATATSSQGGGFLRLDAIGDDGTLTLLRRMLRNERGPDPGGYADHLAALAFSPEGRLLALVETAVGDSDARPPGWRADLVVYETDAGRFRWHASIDAELTGDDRPLDAIIGPDGDAPAIAFTGARTLACGATGDAILLFDADGGGVRGRLPLPDVGAIRALSLEPGGGALWVVCEDGALVRVPLTAR